MASSDIVFDHIRWPEIPNGLDPKLQRYLRELQAAIDARVRGSLYVTGDVVVGGYLVLMGPNRIKTYIP